MSIKTLVRKRAQKITLDPSHPSHPLFELLPSGRHYRAPITRTARHKNSFFPQTIHLMNSKCPPPPPPPLCNNNNKKKYLYLLPPPPPASPSILFHSIIYSTTVHTIIYVSIAFPFQFFLFIYIYIYVYFLFSSYFYWLCVVVVSVNWKLMTLKQIPCMRRLYGLFRAYLAIKALSDSDSDYQ